MEIPAADLSRIRELYSLGRYRQALEQAAKFGSFLSWSSTPARLLAGRLSMQLGAPRMGRKLHAAAYRATPSNLEAVYYHARYRFERFGPLACWRFITTQSDWSDASPELRADWLAFNGFILSRLRDFDRAERYLEQAQHVAPHRAWIQVERAAVLESADESDQAIQTARKALQLQPWFRPAVQAVAHLLQKLGCEEEAAEFLKEAIPHLESGIVWAHLATIQLELHQYDAALESLDAYEQHSPLLEKEGRKWLHARRADAYYGKGDWNHAITHAQELDDEFYKTFSRNLSGRPSEARATIKMKMPALSNPQSETLSDLLSAFWNHPVPNQPFESMVVNDGLPDAVERTRFEDSGWVCREFTFDSEVASELMAAELPFFLSLVEVGVTQTRMVVGIDTVRESLFLRDILEHRSVEAPWSIIQSRYQSTGPRCLIAVPLPDAERLNGITLPDVDAYDELHRIHRLFMQEKQTDAKSAYDAFRAEYVGHRLVKSAGLLWARLTGNTTLLIETLDQLLVDYPNDSTLLLARVNAYRELGRTRQRRAELAGLVAKPDADPLFLQSYAQVLLPDFQQQAETNDLLRRSIRLRPQAAAGYFLLGSQKWERGNFDEAIDLYRFATCLDDREEQFAETYFRTAQCLDLAPEALRLFQRRVTKSTVPNPATVRSLVNALLERDEPEQAFAALDHAIMKLKKREQDDTTPIIARHQISIKPRTWLAELQLFRAEIYARFRRFTESDADLEDARSRISTGVWHKTAARISRIRSSPGETLDHLTATVAADPTWHDGHRLIVGVLIETHGIVAARAYVGALVNRFPHSYPIQRLRAELLSPLPEDVAILSVQNILELCPNDAWARRQLALVYADRKRDADACEQITIAGGLEPNHSSHFAVLGHIHRRADRIDQAMAIYREALRMDADHELAANELVRLARDRTERMENLQFIVEQLHQQPHTGEGLVAYRDLVLSLASDDDDHEEMIEDLYHELDRALDERPDLWQTWSLMTQQLGIMQRLEEARSVAIEGTERFPLIAQLWSDLARVLQALERTDESIDALKIAVRVAPDFSPASLELAEALREAGEENDSITVLERALQKNPLDAMLHTALADRLWDAGHSEEALERAKIAIRLEPGQEMAWRMVLHWSDRLDRPHEVLDIARELTQTRPGDSRGWLKLSRLLNEPEQHAEALTALETVIRLDPLNVEAHDQKAERLAEMGRFDEALEAAHPGELSEDLPFVLQGRAAWIEARRGNYTRAIPPMQRLVSVEPEYFWGWQQLAEWYSETDRKDEYLDATGELVRLKPDHPMPLTMRGEAKLKNHDRAGAKADLRDALRLAPQYAPAAAILFDACLADHEFRDARMALAVLQEHAAGPEVLVKQIQLACRIDDAETALRGLAELASSPGDGPPVAMQLAINEIENTDWEARASKVLHDILTEGESFNPWTPLFWLDTKDGKQAGLDERLATIDRAIQHFPTFAPAYDRKAEILTLVGRYEEALAACYAPEVGNPPPLTLRGRIAWIEAKRGQRSKAITLMKAVVTDDPLYLWGWRNLAQWYDAEGRKRECLDASEQMVQLAPDDPVSYGYRGEARKSLGDRAAAKADFARAFELDPNFDAAGLHLIAELIEANQLEDALMTLNRLREHSDSPLVKLRAIQLSASRGELAEGRTEFRRLATHSDSPATLIREAVHALDRAGWSAEIDDELNQIARGPETNAAVVSVWIERLIGRGRESEVAESLQEIYLKNPNAGREATLGYALAMAQQGHAEKTATTIHRFADELRSDLDSWARSGAALAESKHYALAISWLSDWNQREGVDAGVLRVLTNALRAQDRDAEALQIARDALAMPGPALALAEHRSWVALDTALEGQSEEATVLLNQVDRIGLPDRIRLVVAIADALIMVLRAGPDAKKDAFIEAKDHLFTSAGSCHPADVPPGLMRRYRKVVKRIAEEASHFQAKIWAWWQQSRPWLRSLNPK